MVILAVAVLEFATTVPSVHSVEMIACTFPVVFVSFALDIGFLVQCH